MFIYIQQAEEHRFFYHKQETLNILPPLHCLCRTPSLGIHQLGGMKPSMSPCHPEFPHLTAVLCNPVREEVTLKELES